jgi:hypothetical protein
MWMESDGGLLDFSNCCTALLSLWTAKYIEQTFLSPVLMAITLMRLEKEDMLHHKKHSTQVIAVDMD